MNNQVPASWLYLTIKLNLALRADTSGNTVGVAVLGRRKTIDMGLGGVSTVALAKK
jgi:hypothetical protein